MSRLIAAVLTSLFAANIAFAQAPATPATPPQAATPSADSTCEARAVDKNGKPLAGAARASFMKKCHAEAGGKAGCEAKAVDKNGKPLAGAARSSFMKKCEADAKAAR